MPAEWTPHAACWMAWPCHPVSYDDMEVARNAFAVVARAIARFEPLTMVARTQDVDAARRLCGEQVRVLALPIDDPADAPALEAIARALPDREVVAVPGLEIVKAEGCVHCITQQEPAP